MSKDIYNKFNFFNKTIKTNSFSTIFSAIQPSGKLTIGNYIGVLKKWKEFQKKDNCIYCIADQHALTTSDSLLNLKENILDTLSLLLACDIDPNQSLIFLQSKVSQHIQLYWILNCYVYFGELKRMNQFKKKLKDKNFKKINSGLFNYPVLMAADILLYQSNKVIIGSDQKQHLELTKIIAKRFNKNYGNIFTIPKIIQSKHGSKICSLQNPLKKMSKSDLNKNNFITLLENPIDVKKKIKISHTDSDYPPKILYDIKNKPGISNLIRIYSELSNKNISLIEKEFINCNYNEFKSELIFVVQKLLKNIQEKFNYFKNKENFLKEILISGSEKAEKRAKRKLEEILNVIGIF